MRISREQAQDMSDAHAEGLHDGLAREGCPDCEDRPLTSYPTAAQLHGLPKGTSGFAGAAGWVAPEERHEQ
jgi:hypothetical protein